MKTFVILALLLGSLTTAESPVGPASPELSTVEQIRTMPPEQWETERCAMKRVMLLRMLFLVHDRYRSTPEHSAECLALARQLQAPKAYIALLEAEAPLSGRNHYEHQRAMSQLMNAYALDELSARLLAESVRCDEKQARELVEWLPMQHVFNLVPGTKPDLQDITNQLQALRELFECMEKEYAGVKDRASADAAADALLTALPFLTESAHVRLIIRKQQSTDLPGYHQIVQPIENKLNELRIRLIESAFYGSKRLIAMDELLCL